MKRNFTPRHIAEAVLKRQIPCSKGRIEAFPLPFLESCSDLDMIDRAVLQLEFCTDQAVKEFFPEGQRIISEAVNIVSMNRPENI